MTATIGFRNLKTSLKEVRVGSELTHFKNKLYVRKNMTFLLRSLADCIQAKTRIMAVLGSKNDLLGIWLLNLWRRNYFFLILAHTVYKMWIIQEPKKLALWNKLHFEEKKKESIEHV